MYLLGLYDVHFIFNFAKAAARTDLHYTAHVTFAAVRGDPAAPRLINVFSQPPRGAVQQHLGVVARARRARDRRAADRGARPTTRASPTSSGTGSTTPASGGASRRHILVLRAAARLPADDVHDHRLRRLGARLRGDARAPRVARRRASGARSSTRRRSAGSCCWRSRSRSRTATKPKSTKPATRRSPIFETRAHLGGGEGACS